jgi:hypothetical protein
LIRFTASFFPLPWASVVAVRLLLAMLTAVGYSLLAAAAFSRDANRWNVAAVLGLGLLATSMTLVVVPEFYGLSHGILAIGAGVALWRGSVAIRVVVLLILTFLAGGTTITNGFLPFGLAVVVTVSHFTLPQWFLRRLPRLMALLIALVIVSATLLALGPFRRLIQETRAGVGVGKATHYRWITQPAQAVRFSINGLIFPIIGPAPSVEYNARPQLTYHSRSVLDLSVLQAIAASALVVLLGLAVVSSWRLAADRLLIVVLSGWVLANLIAHNFWGYEMMLYAPHYSFALLVILWLGSARLSAATVVPLAGMIAIGQVQTLIQIIGALPPR